MSLIKQEVKDIVATVTLSPAVYTIRHGYGGDLRLEPTDKITIASESMFVDNVKYEIHEKLNKHIGHQISTGNAEDRVRNTINDYIIRFLINYQECKKPKLTTLYKWYKTNAREYEMSRDSSFEDSLYSITKYLHEHWDEMRTNKVHAKNGIGLLLMLKDRYEKKGWKLS